MQPAHQTETTQRMGAAFSRRDCFHDAGAKLAVPQSSNLIDSASSTAGNARDNRKVLVEKLGLLIVLVAYALSAWLTWRKWPDLLVDFGAQLYLPWRISAGDVLYRDVMYLTGGPVSQYYHAMLFKLFGVSFLTLIISNLAIGLGVVVVMYRQFRSCSDAWTASTIGLGVTLVLAFGQYSDIGNYNFIAPYCHEVWHGVALSIVAISFLSSWALEGRAIFARAAGCCGGLVFMTKPEVFIALMLAFVATYVFTLKHKGFKAALSLLVCLLGFGILPLLGFLFYFRQFESWTASARSVAFAWVPLLTTSISKEVFYRWCMGLDAPGFHIGRMLLQFAIVCGVAGFCAFCFRRDLNTSIKRLGAVAFVASLIALASGVDWVDAGRSLPLLVLMLGVLLAAKYLKSYRQGIPALVDESPDTAIALDHRSAVFPLIWSVFAFVLLAKLGFFSRIWHYGFILGMPAFVAAIFLLHWHLPGVLEKYGVRRNPFRVAIWLLLMTAFLRLFVQSQHVLSAKTVAVGEGKDKILSFNEKVHPAGPAVQLALAWMDKNARPEATLAVLPEGVVVNYLSRRINPTKYMLWNPAEIVGLGQNAMTTSFQQNAPDYVMLIHRDPSEYGVKFFGQDEKYGLNLMRWIESNYQPVCLFGDEPLRDSHFGIKILKRIPPTQPG